MPAAARKKIKIALIILLILGVFFLLELCSLLVQQNTRNRIAAHIQAIVALKSEIIEHVMASKKPATIADVPLVASWMTFDYINHLFALPPAYLAKTLDIKDPRYPHIALEDYAEVIHTRKSIEVSDVQQAITAYFTSRQ